MTKKDNSKTVTAANVISAVGIVLLAFFTYIGHSYQSGGETGWDILIAVLIAGIAALLLWWLIKAKGAENEIDKWKKIEIASLIAYIVLIIPASYFGGIMHFFLVNDNKTLIKQNANQDLTKLTKLFSDYEASAKDALARTRTGMIPAIGANQKWSGDLTKFMNDNHISRSKKSVETFIGIQEKALLEGSYKKLKSNFSEQKRKITNVVNGWSPLQVPSMSKLIEQLAPQVIEQLNSLRKKGKLPAIEYSADNGMFILNGYHSIPEVKLMGGTEGLKFHKMLTSAKGFSILGLMVILGIHFLILFNYIFAYRTNTLGINKNTEDDGGISLQL